MCGDSHVCSGVKENTNVMFVCVRRCVNMHGMCAHVCEGLYGACGDVHMCDCE